MISYLTILTSSNFLSLLSVYKKREVLDLVLNFSYKQVFKLLDNLFSLYNFYHSLTISYAFIMESYYENY